MRILPSFIQPVNPLFSIDLAIWVKPLTNAVATSSDRAAENNSQIGVSGYREVCNMGSEIRPNLSKFKTDVLSKNSRYGSAFSAPLKFQRFRAIRLIFDPSLAEFPLLDGCEISSFLDEASHSWVISCRRDLADPCSFDPCFPCCSSKHLNCLAWTRLGPSDAFGRTFLLLLICRQSDWYAIPAGSSVRRTWVAGLDRGTCQIQRMLWHTT